MKTDLFPPENAPVSAHILHSIEKWQGNAALPRQAWVTGSTSCALCQHFRVCHDCPLKNCDRDSPYDQSVSTGNASYILSALFKAYFDAVVDKLLSGELIVRKYNKKQESWQNQAL